MSKKILKKFLYDISTPEEIAEMEKMTEREDEEKINTEKTLALLSGLTESLKQSVSSSPKNFQKVSESFGEFTKQLSIKLDDLKEVNQNSEKLTVPLYKSMINAISGVNKSIIDKPTPVWRWPQYASVSVRNRNFANIDPAVDSLNLGEYDSVAVTYPTDTVEVYNFFQNGLAGSNVGTVTITYTDNTKNFINSVVKTPIVTT